MKKARMWDTLCALLESGMHPGRELSDISDSIFDLKGTFIVEKISSAFQAKLDLESLQFWILIKAKLSGDGKYAEYVEKSLEEWRKSRGAKSVIDDYECAPKGTLERIMEVEEVLHILEDMRPIRKEGGLLFHSSEDLDYIKIRLRIALGLPFDFRKVWGRPKAVEWRLHREKRI